MKTPEEIKRALTMCAVGCHPDCPYHGESDDYACQEVLVFDARVLIDQLESRMEG